MRIYAQGDRERALLTFACRTLDWLHRSKVVSVGVGELGPGLRRGAVGERLSKGPFIVVDFVSSVSEFPVEN